MTNKIKTTHMQLRALEIKQQDPKISMRQAMIRAGYTKVSASHPKQNLIERKGVQQAIENFSEQLVGLGVTTDFMAKKYLEWLTATKIKTSLTESDKTVPDYATQLGVKDDVVKMLGISPVANPNLKKRVIAEDFFEI